jgi:hypothetical protein
MPTPRAPRSRTTAPLLKIALPCLLLALGVAGGGAHTAPPPALRPVGCPTDLAYPVTVSVTPLGSVRGNAPVTARIEVT